MSFKFLKTVLTSCRYAMCISLGVLSVSGTASATLIESIAALEEGARYRVLFTTRDVTAATSGDIDDYNTFVSNAAVSGSVTGSLGLTWKALASTGDMHAMDNTGIFNYDSSVITMFNTNGQIVASSGFDLWSGGSNGYDYPIRYDEDGARYHTNVWTGTNHDGSVIQDRTLGLEYGSKGFWGFSGSHNDDMISYATGSMVNPFSLYAVSAVSEKLLTDVPEPSSVILMLLGLAGLSFARYRKQY
jgi:hypothetical protein